MTGRILSTFAFAILFTCCDLSEEVPVVEVAQCDVFDERCLPCEASGEGEPCEVDGAYGICTKMRIIQGPQVYIAGLRCRAD